MTRRNAYNTDQIDDMPQNTSDKETDKYLNFCMRNHPQSERENVDGIVFDLLRSR